MAHRERAPLRRRIAARRAWRLLLGTALVFFALQLAVGLVLDAAPLAVRLPEGATALASLHGDPPPAFVFFGSSRFQASIEPGAMSRVLRTDHGEAAPRVERVTVLGGDVVATRFLFERMLAEGVRPRFAVIELSPEWLALPPHFLGAQLVRIFGWREIAHWLPEIWIRDVDTLTRARLVPVYHYRRELLTWLVGRPPPYLAAPKAGAAAGEAQTSAETTVEPDSAPAPDVAPAGAPPRSAEEGATRGASRWARRVRPYRTSERAIAELDALLAQCRAAGITCLLLGPPLSTVHRAIYGPDVAARYGEILARAEHEDGTRYLEWGDRVPDDEFWDSSHVSAPGLVRFSTLVARELVEPLWFGGDDGVASGPRSGATRRVPQQPERPAGLPLVDR